MLKVGSVIAGKYRVVDQIGAGGMSVVWQARNDRSNKIYAVKEVRREFLSGNRMAEAGLVAETETLKSLRHDHIVGIDDVIDTDDAKIIVMDFVEGTSLGEPRTEDLRGSETVPLKDGAFPQNDVIRWARQLAAVFGYLHDQKPPIVYRDLKPSNIMLKPNGDLVLVDFGTARRFADGRLQSISGAGGGTVALGTHGYAAPEVVMGDLNTDRADPRSDIYSLGVTLFHLVTGRNPTEPPYGVVPIRQLNPALSSGLEKIISKCTRQNPNDRYRSCAELLYDLEHYQEIDDDFQRGLRRRLTAFVAVAVACLVFLLAGIGLSIASANLRDADYDQIVARALAETDGSPEQVALFQTAIKLKPVESAAWLEFLRHVRSDSDEFSTSDNTAYKDMLALHRADIMQSPQWPDVAYEAGLTYGFFQTGADRDTKAAQAFADVVATGRTDLEYWDRANLFNKVFGYRSEAGQKLSTVDFKDYWQALQEMVADVKRTGAQRDVAGIGALLLPTQVLTGQVDRFLTDGVPPTEITQLLNDVDELTTGLTCDAGSVDIAVQNECSQLRDSLAKARTELARHAGSGG